MNNKFEEEVKQLRKELTIILNSSNAQAISVITALTELLIIIMPDIFNKENRRAVYDAMEREMEKIKFKNKDKGKYHA